MLERYFSPRLMCDCMSAGNPKGFRTFQSALVNPRHMIRLSPSNAIPPLPPTPTPTPPLLACTPLETAQSARSCTRCAPWRLCNRTQGERRLRETATSHSKQGVFLGIITLACPLTLPSLHNQRLALPSPDSIKLQKLTVHLIYVPSLRSNLNP